MGQGIAKSKIKLDKGNKLILWECVREREIETKRSFRGAGFPFVFEFVGSIHLRLVVQEWGHIFVWLVGWLGVVSSLVPLQQLVTSLV